MNHLQNILHLLSAQFKLRLTGLIPKAEAMPIHFLRHVNNLLRSPAIFKGLGPADSM